MSNPRLDRLQIMLTTDELCLLDDWRFAHRLPSRSAAVRELIRRGLAAEGYAIDRAAKSKDFGLADIPPRKSARSNGQAAQGRSGKRDDDAPRSR